jgi:hypothetical protein
MTFPHEISLPSGATMTVLSVEPSPAELRGFSVRIGKSTVTTFLSLLTETPHGDFTDAMDKLTAIANDAHESAAINSRHDALRQDEADNCGDGGDIFAKGASPG